MKKLKWGSSNLFIKKIFVLRGSFWWLCAENLENIKKLWTIWQIMDCFSIKNRILTNSQYYRLRWSPWLVFGKFGWDHFSRHRQRSVISSSMRISTDMPKEEGRLTSAWLGMHSSFWTECSIIFQWHCAQPSSSCWFGSLFFVPGPIFYIFLKILTSNLDSKGLFETSRCKVTFLKMITWKKKKLYLVLGLEKQIKLPRQPPPP